MEARLEAILTRAIEQVDGADEPHWSAVPVVGYRAWTISGGTLRGARAVWPEPRFSARCVPVPGSIGDVAGVPHTDGRCGRLGCGVYALADPAMLGGKAGRVPAGHRPGLVLGAVALTGKVVEHERGYRGRFAEVVAAGTVWRGRVVMGDRSGWLARLFADPVAALQEPGPGVAVEGWAGPRPEATGRLIGMLEHAAFGYLQRFVPEDQED